VPRGTPRREELEEVGTTAEAAEEALLLWRRDRPRPYNPHPSKQAAPRNIVLLDEVAASHDDAPTKAPLAMHEHRPARRSALLELLKRTHQD